MSKRKKIRCAEFCTGVGGFRLGLEASELKVEVVYSNEINEACEKTYKANFGKGFDSKDLLSLDSKLLPDFDMICAGFPCQPFSIAGKELGFGDPRGGIFFKLLEIIRTKQPSIIFLENVVNLVRHDHGSTYKTILKKLEDEGYSLSPKILDSSYFGVPQSRSRIYIVGLLRKQYGDRQVVFTERRTCRTAFAPFVDRTERTNTVTARWNEYIDLYTGRKTLEEMSFDVPRTRQSLERINKGCDLTDCVFQARSSGIRALSLADPFPTFTVLNSGGGAHVPVLSKERRHLSLTEMKRIMGFPEWYDFTAVSRTDAAKQLANAVCPPVITSICNDINQTCFQNGVG